MSYLHILKLIIEKVSYVNYNLYITINTFSCSLIFKEFNYYDDINPDENIKLELEFKL